MKKTIGIPARKDQFFARPEIRKAILESIYTGSNILLTAPRRFGKTSVLLNLFDVPESDTDIIYLDTESINNEEAFFTEILTTIQTKYHKPHEKLLTKARKMIPGKLKIKDFEIELPSTHLDKAYNTLCDYLKQLDKSKKITIILDEFPITLENISKGNNEDAAIRFLRKNRSIRQNPILSPHITFIYCGSIGLNHVVKKLGATDTINDLEIIKVEELSTKDAMQMTKKLLAENRIEADTKNLMYLLEKIELTIPFYIQLITNELNNLNRNGEFINLTHVLTDKAFKNVIKNGNNHLEHYKKRLSRVFSKEALKFVNLLLSALTDKNKMDLSEITDLYTGFDLPDSLTDILEILETDGYLAENNYSYQFYSPILKNWWK